MEIDNNINNQVLFKNNDSGVNSTNNDNQNMYSPKSYKYVPDHNIHNIGATDDIYIKKSNPKNRPFLNNNYCKSDTNINIVINYSSEKTSPNISPQFSDYTCSPANDNDSMYNRIQNNNFFYNYPMPIPNQSQNMYSQYNNGYLFQHLLINNTNNNPNYGYDNVYENSMGNTQNHYSTVPGKYRHSNTVNSDPQNNNFDPTSTIMSCPSYYEQKQNFYLSPRGNPTVQSLPIPGCNSQYHSQPLIYFQLNPKIDEISNDGSSFVSRLSKPCSVMKVADIEIFPIDLTCSPLTNEYDDSLSNIPFEELFKRIDELYEFPFPMLPVILPDPSKMYCEDKPSYCYKFHFLCTPANENEIHFLDDCVSYGYNIPNYKVFLVENMTLLRLGLYFIVKNGLDVDPPPEIKSCLKKSLHPNASEYFHNMINILNKYIDYNLKSENSDVDKFNKLVDICKEEIASIRKLILGLLSNTNTNRRKKNRSTDLGIRSESTSKNKLNDKVASSEILNSKGIDDDDNITHKETVKFTFSGFCRINILENKIHDRYMCIKHYLRQKILNEIDNQLQLYHGTVSQIEEKKVKISKNRINDIIDETITIGKVQNMNKCNLSKCFLTSFPKILTKLFGIELLNLNKNCFEEFPQEISSFKDLKHLNLKCNNITAITNSIKSNKLLETLDISRNKLFYISKEIANLKFLKECNLENNKLTYIPDEITKLKSLTILKLKNNRLLSLPINIGNLNNLEIITLTNNKLNELPESFSMLNKIKELDLTNNCLAILPSNMGNMTSLNKLILDNNKLEFLPTNFSNLSNLIYLSFINNKIERLPDTFGNLYELKELDASDNIISELPNSFVYLRNIELINFDYNGIKSLPMGFGNLKNLKYLYMANNNLETLTDDLGGLENIEELSLEYNNIGSISEKFCSLKKLRSLVLQSNKLEHIPDYINNMTSLEELNIAGNDLVDLPNTLIDLPNLKRLDLQNNEETLKKIPNNIINMKRLECLYINSKTSKTFMENLESFENLKELSLVEFKFNFSHYVNLKVITKLILHDCKMSKIPNNILLLSNLRELWLTKNNLKKIPNSINLLSQLVILNLKNNRIKRIPPKIGDMTYLKELDLSFNRISKIPVELYHSNTLEKLNLKKNLIKILPKQFAAIKSLKELDLSYNNLLEIPKEIYELENLKILNLQYNTDIITINPKICCLEKLEHLKIFDFDIPISTLKEHDYEYDV